MCVHGHFDVAAHVLGRVELRFLRQEADVDAGLRPRFAVELLVDAGHDPQQRGLAGAVQAEHADLGAGEEAQGDVAKDDPLRGYDLADAIHRVNELCHWEDIALVVRRSRKRSAIIGHQGHRTLPLPQVGAARLPYIPLQGPAPLDADRSAVAAGADGGQRRA